VLKNKTAMSCGFIALRPETAVNLHRCPPTHPLDKTERMDGAQLAKALKNKTAMSCGFIALRPESAVILHGCPPTHPLDKTERMDGAQLARQLEIQPEIQPEIRLKTQPEMKSPADEESITGRFFL
jgi:hypothetical protein